MIIVRIVSIIYISNSTWSLDCNRQVKSCLFASSINSKIFNTWVTHEFVKSRRLVVIKMTSWWHCDKNFCVLKSSIASNESMIKSQTLKIFSSHRFITLIVALDVFKIESKLNLSISSNSYKDIAISLKKCNAFVYELTSIQMMYS